MNQAKALISVTVCNDQMATTIGSNDLIICYFQQQGLSDMVGSKPRLKFHSCSCGKVKDLISHYFQQDFGNKGRVG